MQLGKPLLTICLISTGCATQQSRRTSSDTDTNQSGGISQQTLDEVSRIEQEKKLRTPAQRKIDSHLLDAIKACQDKSRPSDAEFHCEERALVDIKAKISPPLLRFIKKLGGQVINNIPRENAMRALMPLDSLENFAAKAEVISIETAVAFHKN